jgi:thiaminase
MTQIKANAARLMRYTSIMIAINKCLVVYNLIANPGSRGIVKEEIYKKINNLYSNSRARNEMTRVTNQMIDSFVDKLLAELKV